MCLDVYFYLKLLIVEKYCVTMEVSNWVRGANMTKNVVLAGNRAYKTPPNTATLLYLVILIIIWVFFFTLSLNQDLKCIFYETTGLYCSGCGITRMFLSLLRFEFYQAFRYNPLIFSLGIFLILYLIYCFIKYKKIKPINNKLSIVLIIITILFGIFRNIEFFNFLAPTVI